MHNPNFPNMQMVLLLTVHLPEKCCFAPIDTGQELCELDEVFCSLMVLLHTKSFECCLGFSDGIESAEVGFQFFTKKVEVGALCGTSFLCE